MLLLGFQTNQFGKQSIHRHESVCWYNTPRLQSLEESGRDNTPTANLVTCIVSNRSYLQISFSISQSKQSMIYIDRKQKSSCEACVVLHDVERMYHLNDVYHTYFITLQCFCSQEQFMLSPGPSVLLYISHLLAVCSAVAMRRTRSTLDVVFGFGWRLFMNAFTLNPTTFALT